MIEHGRETIGEKKEIATDSPMVEGVIYEFHYSVISLPLGFLEGLWPQIIVVWGKLINQFKGLVIMHWRLTETELVFQARGLTGAWEEIALSVVALAAQNLFSEMGIIITIKKTFQFTKVYVVPRPSRWVLVGALSALGLFLFFATRKRG